LGGAILSAPPPNTSFTAVSASFVVPHITPPTSGNGTWSGGVWVGIDGFYNREALLQAGVNWVVNFSDTSATTYDYYAWYEWFPATWQDYAIDIAPGDKMTEWC
jgi:hypothetical protein